MATFHITCVKKDWRGTITEVGLTSMAGDQPLAKWCEAKESVAERIKSGDAVYVRSPDPSAPRPRVHAVKGFRGTFLRTDADATEADNLGELPDCTDC